MADYRCDCCGTVPCTRVASLNFETIKVCKDCNKSLCECNLSAKPIKDSGKRDEFQTGAVRDVGEGKGAYELISPIFLRRLALHLEKGAQKYQPHNWRKGMPLSRTFQSLIRHAYQYLGGDRSEDHLAAIACNISFIIHYEECIKNGVLPKELDDISKYGEYMIFPEAEWIKNLNVKK